MNMQVLVKRKATLIAFSRDFEAKLFMMPTDHISLTHDLELQAGKGAELLRELEDVSDIKHVDTIKQLIEATNQYLQMESKHFSKWSINIAEELLDEVDLILLTHGEDLKDLGLLEVNQGTILVLLATAALQKLSF